MYVHTFVFIVLASMIVMLLLKCSTQLAYRVDVQNNINNTNFNTKLSFSVSISTSCGGLSKGRVASVSDGVCGVYTNSDGGRSNVT